MSIGSVEGDRASSLLLPSVSGLEEWTSGEVGLFKMKPDDIEGFRICDRSGREKVVCKFSCGAGPTRSCCRHNDTGLVGDLDRTYLCPDPSCANMPWCSAC
jgi:hypothetical protein